VHAEDFANIVGHPQQASAALPARRYVIDLGHSIRSELKSIAVYNEACGAACIGQDSDLTYRPSAL
jgi:hypothetical protein